LGGLAGSANRSSPFFAAAFFLPAPGIFWHGQAAFDGRAPAGPARHSRQPKPIGNSLTDTVDGYLEPISLSAGNNAMADHFLQTKSFNHGWDRDEHG